MTFIEQRTEQAAAPSAEPISIDDLRIATRGEIVTPSDSAYAEASRVWNADYDGAAPALIARCSGAADVIAAVAYARTNDKEISDRSAHGFDLVLALEQGARRGDCGPVHCPARMLWITAAPRNLSCV